MYLLNKRDEFFSRDLKLHNLVIERKHIIKILLLQNTRQPGCPKRTDVNNGEVDRVFE